MSSDGAEQFDVRVVGADELVDLRRRVLRGADPRASASDPRDGDVDALHLGGFLAGRLVASASWFPCAGPIDVDGAAYQLRFMATDFDVQGRGYGSVMLERSRAELGSRGAVQIWAKARDSALGFYRATGWTVVEGSEHVSAETGLAHTVIYMMLDG